MPTRILSISGLRGLVGDGLDPAYITEFAMAVGTLSKGGTVVVSRDGRSTGVMIKQAVIAGLMATGCKVIDAEIATTPTCGVLVSHHKAAGGIQITASHNPIPWNGLKPFTPRGSVYDAEWGAKLINILENKAFALKDYSGLGTVEVLENAAGPHIERVHQLIDPKAIQAKSFKVVLDCNRGSGGVATPEFLRSLGCEVIVLGEKPDGAFEHTPEPLAENLTGLCEAVRQHGAQAGFAQDPDADRLAIVDEQGNYIGEELTLALAVDYILPKRKGPVVVNGSTSRVTADIAEKHGCEFHRSHVGEANVVAKMLEVNASIGGEGNGGVIEPNVGFVRDSYVSMAYVLAGLAEQGVTLSEWVNDIPKYSIVKQKIECPREHVGKACTALAKAFDDAQATTGDGLRLDWNDRWVQVRASNTEPIIRVISEAPDEASAQELCKQALDVVRASL